MLRLLIPLHSKYPAPYGFPMGVSLKQEKPPRLRWLLSSLALPILARLLVVKSFLELGHYGIVAGKVPTHPGSTRLLYACVEVWRALISRRLGFGDMAGQIVI